MSASVSVCRRCSISDGISTFPWLLVVSRFMCSGGVHACADDDEAPATPSTDGVCTQEATTKHAPTAAAQARARCRATKNEGFTHKLRIAVLPCW